MRKRPQRKGDWIPLWMAAEMCGRDAEAFRFHIREEMRGGNPLYMKDGPTILGPIYIHATEVERLKTLWPLSSGLVPSVA